MSTLAPASACLRTFDSEATETSVTCLPGMPQSIGVGPDQSAGVILAVTPDRAIAITSASAGWWDQLIAEAMRTRDELVYGAGLTPALNGGAR